LTPPLNNTRIQEIVFQIDDCCIDANIDRHTIWVPRDLNIIANYRSKLGSGDAATLIPSQFSPESGPYWMIPPVPTPSTNSPLTITLRWFHRATAPYTLSQMQNGLTLSPVTGGAKQDFSIFSSFFFPFFLV
jgi:hypothetical protein